MNNEADNEVFSAFMRTIANKQSEKPPDPDKMSYFPEQIVKHYGNRHDGITFYNNQSDFKGLPEIFIAGLVEYNLKTHQQ